MLTRCWSAGSSCYLLLRSVCLSDSSMPSELELLPVIWRMCGSVTKRRECSAQFDRKYHLKNQQWHKWIKGITNKKIMYIPTCDEFCMNAPKKTIVKDSCFPCGVLKASISIWLDLLCPLRFPTCLFSKTSLNELNCKHDFTSFKSSCS